MVSWRRAGCSLSVRLQKLKVTASQAVLWLPEPPEVWVSPLGDTGRVSWGLLLKVVSYSLTITWGWKAVRHKDTLSSGCPAQPPELAPAPTLKSGTRKRPEEELSFAAGAVLPSRVVEGGLTGKVTLEYSRLSVCRSPLGASGCNF